FLGLTFLNRGAAVSSLGFVPLRTTLDLRDFRGTEPSTSYRRLTQIRNDNLVSLNNPIFRRLPTRSGKRFGVFNHPSMSDQSGGYLERNTHVSRHASRHRGRWSLSRYSPRRSARIHVAPAIAKVSAFSLQFV